MAHVELTQVAKVGSEAGTLPESMSAWVIRQERESEPRDAFQLEEIEVPEPGAFEVVVQVMAAGVNFSNVWAALGEPVSVIGSHFANAWEATKANELIEQGLVRPVLWRTMGFEQVAEAHQLMRENRHLGKISILVGASSEGLGRTEEGRGAIRAEVGG